VVVSTDNEHLGSVSPTGEWAWHGVTSRIEITSRAETRECQEGRNVYVVARGGSCVTLTSP